MKVIGVFSGVGGIELGFEQAGYEIVWSNEIDKNAAETFRKNFNHKLVVDDIYIISSLKIYPMQMLLLEVSLVKRFLMQVSKLVLMTLEEPCFLSWRGL